MNGNYLSHYGVLGMKWGVQNGPPYPLDSARMSKTEKSAQKKAEAIKNGDVHYAKRHKKDFSNEDLDRLVNRYQHTRKVDELSFDKTIVDRHMDRTGSRLKTMAQITGSIVALGVFYEKVTGQPVWKKVIGG